MNFISEPYRALIARAPITPTDPTLRIAANDSFSCHYAPFDHINVGAQVVLLGITPGAQQARNAIDAYRNAILRGNDMGVALAEAKATASFSGAMRRSLVSLLDHIGLDRVLGLPSCGELFSSRSSLVHFTSALRYPVFHRGKDYSGTPPVLATPFLKGLMDRWLREEVETLAGAYWVPLGKEPAAVLASFVAEGALDRGRVLSGLPHPSGANAERIAYFLGRKPRSQLSAKTSADTLDAARDRLMLELGRPLVAPPKVQIAASFGRTSVALESTVSRPASTSVPPAGKVAQAEALIASRLSPIRAANAKIAGFETPTGRHLAIQRPDRSINIWTEDLSGPEAFRNFERYSAARPRHSNLAAHAPRVAAGRPARLWRLESTADVAALLDWYERV